ncbi:hypothetical protein FOZ63_006174, partial [Perkinsus olseni]
AAGIDMLVVVGGMKIGGRVEGVGGPQEAGKEEEIVITIITQRRAQIGEDPRPGVKAAVIALGMILGAKEAERCEIVLGVVKVIIGKAGLIMAKGREAGLKGGSGTKERDRDGQVVIAVVQAPLEEESGWDQVNDTHSFDPTANDAEHQQPVAAAGPPVQNVPPAAPPGGGGASPPSSSGKGGPPRGKGFGGPWPPAFPPPAGGAPPGGKGKGAWPPGSGGFMPPPNPMLLPFLAGKGLQQMRLKQLQMRQQEAKEKLEKKKFNAEEKKKHLVLIAEGIVKLLMGVGGGARELSLELLPDEFEKMFGVPLDVREHFQESSLLRFVQRFEAIPSTTDENDHTRVVPRALFQ